MSAIWPLADCDLALHMTAYKPKRTLLIEQAELVSRASCKVSGAAYPANLKETDFGDAARPFPM